MSEVVTDPRRRALILATMCAALIAVVASMSGLNVAQQALAAELGASQNQLLWAINGYTLALAALLMPIGAIGDRFGRKPVLIVGLLIFSIASVVSITAGDPSTLIIGRIIAGVGAAMIMPVTLSVITSSFPAENRAQAVGIWAGFAGAGGILGLVSSAAIIDYASWPWVFAAPLVAALVSMVMTIVLVPNSRDREDGRFDTVGSLLSAFAVGGLVLGIHEGPERGWTDWLTVLGVGGGALALIGFIAWELRQRRPLLDVRVFRNRTLATGSISLTALFAVMFALFLVVVQYLQAVLGWSALTSAAALLPLAMIMMPLSAVAPRIAQRVGYRPTLLAGMTFVLSGLVIMALLADADSGYETVLPGLLVFGIGTGLCMSPSTTAITESLPVSKQGVASALNDTVRELGASLGVALIGSVLSATYSSNVANATESLPPEVAHAVEEGIGTAAAIAPELGEQGESVMASARDAFVDAWVVSMWVSVVVVAATLAFVVIRAPRRRRDGEPDIVAETLDDLLDGDGSLAPAGAEADAAS